MTVYQNVANIPGAAVGVSTASTAVVAEGPGRYELVITNDSDTVIYLRLAATGAVVGQGIRLAPTGGQFKTQFYSGPVCAIHGGTGTKNLSVAAI